MTNLIPFPVQTPRHQPSAAEEYCEVIMLSVGDDEADQEMMELIQQCGGRKK